MHVLATHVPASLNLAPLTLSIPVAQRTFTAPRPTVVHRNAGRGDSPPRPSGRCRFAQWCDFDSECSCFPAPFAAECATAKALLSSPPYSSYALLYAFRNASFW